MQQESSTNLLPGPARPCRGARRLGGQVSWYCPNVALIVMVLGLWGQLLVCVFAVGAPSTLGHRLRLSSREGLCNTGGQQVEGDASL